MADNKDVKLKLDAAPVAAFEDRLNKAIQNGDINKDGWKIRLDQSHISFVPGHYAHSTIILEGPNGFYSSIDTNTYTGKETNAAIGAANNAGVPYLPGTEMRMTTDHERKGNAVVTDANKLRSVVMAEGKGAEMVLRYLRFAEQAKEFNTSGADYHPFAEDVMRTDTLKPQIQKQRANSNAGPIQILENLGYDVRHAGPNRDVDLRATSFIARGETFNVPGADHRIAGLFPIDKKGLFEGYEGDPSKIITDAKLKGEAIRLMESLHPDVIGLDPDKMAAPTPAPEKPREAAPPALIEQRKTPATEPKPFEHYKQDPGHYTIETGVIKAQELMNKLKGLVQNSGIELGITGDKHDGVDGKFGKLTFKSVVAAQKILGMEVTGGITNDFVKKLQEKIDQLTPQPKLVIPGQREHIATASSPISSRLSLS